MIYFAAFGITGPLLWLAVFEDVSLGPFTRMLWNIWFILVFQLFLSASFIFERKCAMASWSDMCGTRVSFKYSISLMHETSGMPVFIIIMKRVIRNLLCCRRIKNALSHRFSNLEAWIKKRKIKLMAQIKNIWAWMHIRCMQILYACLYYIHVHIICMHMIYACLYYIAYNICMHLITYYMHAYITFMRISYACTY